MIATGPCPPQELNKCKTELQYWRSRSPAVPPLCAECGAALRSSALAAAAQVRPLSSYLREGCPIPVTEVVSREPVRDCFLITHLRRAVSRYWKSFEEMKR